MKITCFVYVNVYSICTSFTIKSSFYNFFNFFKEETVYIPVRILSASPRVLIGRRKQKTCVMQIWKLQQKKKPKKNIQIKECVSWVVRFVNIFITKNNKQPQNVSKTQTISLWKRIATRMARSREIKKRIISVRIYHWLLKKSKRPIVDIGKARNLYRESERI